MSLDNENRLNEPPLAIKARTTTDHRDGLTLLSLSKAEQNQLENMGIISLEQIALHDKDSLGMGKARGDSIIKRAWNILANQHIRKIEADSKKVAIHLDEMNDSILAAVKGIFNAYDWQVYGNCWIETADNQVIIKSRHSGDFGYFLAEAKRRQEMLQARDRQSLKLLGINLERQKILDFARQRGFNGFWREVFSPISGNETMKKALAVAMFSTYMEPVHVLVVGEPGGGKTLGKDIIGDNFLDLTRLGANTTRAGLVCNLSTGQPGALAFSDLKLVLVDEFDKIPEGDIEYCYELLSNGKCQVDSARVHETIESRFIMIAFANPRYGVFRSSPLEEVGLPGTLMSRFAVIVKTESLDREAMQKLFLSKFYGGSELQRLPDYFEQWVKLARLHSPQIECSPEKVSHYINQALELVEKYQNTPLRRDPRMGDYLKRVPMSVARSEFRDLIDSDLDLSLEIFQQSVKEWTVENE